MPITAQATLKRCTDALQDSTHVRWPVDELVRYLNDGQREIALHRPDAMHVRQTATLTPGTRQTLPANAAKLLDITRNGAGRAVRLINREILDAQLPGWHSQPGTTDVLHYMYDVREPRSFLVYPPASAGATLDIAYAAYPTDIAEPASGAPLSAIVGTLSVPDIYANALQDYILARAYSKDSEYAGNANRAQLHSQQFATALGIEINTTVKFSPRSPGNPNAAPPQANT